MPISLTRPAGLCARQQYLLAIALGVGSVWLREALLPLFPVLANRAPFLPVFVTFILLVVLVRPGPFLAAAAVSGVLLAERMWRSSPAPWTDVLLYLAVAGVTGLAAWLSARAQDSQHATWRQAVNQRDTLRVTLASIGDAVITTNAEGRITFMNDTASALTGWPLAQAMGKPLDDVFRRIDGTTREALPDPVVELLQNSAPQSAHGRHVRLLGRDTHDCPIDDNAAVIRAADGSVSGVVLVFRDITERRAAERTIAESEHELAELFESASIGMQWVAPDGRILRANRAQLALLGATRSQVLGQTLGHFHVDGDPMADFMAPLLAGVPVVEHTARLRRVDGAMREVLIRASPRLADGRFVHARCFTLDLTERKRAEQHQRESEQRFRVMADTAPVLVWMAGSDSLCTWFNRPWLAFTGRSMDDELGHGWMDGVHPDDQVRCKATRAAAYAAQRAFSMDYRLRRHDGAWRWLLDNGSPRLDDAGGFVGYIGSCIDITDRKEAEAARAALVLQLRDADRRKDEFLATLAHELRNPLAPVVHGLDVLASTSASAAAQHQAHATIGRQLKHMVRLIDDLLDVSRITQDRLELRPVPVPLQVVLEQALEASRPALAAAGHMLTLQQPAAPLWLHADALRLGQVFSNLLGNAAKYSPDGSAMSLTVEALPQALPDAGQTVQVVVQDRGIGIAPQLLPRIFDMFTQGPPGPGQAVGGLGIGLALAQRLVQLHGGSLVAHSDGPGLGSRFTVELPLVAAPVADAQLAPLAAQPSALAANHAPATAAGPQAPAAWRLLVVDDNHDAATTLAMLLELSGHTVRMAHDGQQALDVAEQFRPDALLLDIGLPVLNGHAVARRLRSLDWARHVVIVALTGWGQAPDREASQEAGFDAHLVKPVELDPLLRVLANLLARPTA